MTNADLRYKRKMLSRIVRGESVSYEELVEAQADLLEAADQATSGATSSSDPRVRAAVDIQRAMSFIQETDPAIPWNRAALLESLGRFEEAADANLAAHLKFTDRAQKGTAITNDEDDWAEAAIYRACRSLIFAGQPLAAGILAQRLESPNLREEIVVLLREVLEDT